MQHGNTNGRTADGRINVEIEILRAIAILMVIVSHFPPTLSWEWNSLVPIWKNYQTWSGVDLFFCVSGFVVTRSLIPTFLSVDRPRFARLAIPFAVRRYFRLAPAVGVSIVVALLLSTFWNESGRYGSSFNNLVDGIGVILYAANWHVYYCINHHGQGYCGFNGLYWSLSLEEQFYFALPILLYFFRRRIVWIAAALIVLQFPLDRPNVSALWHTRTDAICWGVLLAIASTTGIYQRLKPSFLRPWLAPLAAMLLVAFVARMTAVYSPDLRPYKLGVVAILCAALVWIASYDGGLLFPRSRLTAPLVWIGSRSYGIYLLHALCLFAVREACWRLSDGHLSRVWDAPIIIGGIALTFCAVELQYRFIENPLRNKGRRLAARIGSDATRPVTTTARLSSPYSSRSAKA